MRMLSVFLVLVNTVAFAAEQLPPPPPPPPPPSSDFRSEPPPPPPPVEKDDKGPKKNWAQGAAYSGFAMSAVVLSLGITSHFTGHGYEGAIIGNGEWHLGGTLLMLGATLVTAIGTPIVYSGGKSARWTSSITGLFPLRIAGWIAYGVGLAFQIGAIFANEVPSWLGGLIGASALGMFGADALRSASEAADVAIMANDSSGFHIIPVVSILPGRNGNSPGPMLGLAGIF